MDDVRADASEQAGQSDMRSGVSQPSSAQDVVIDPRGSNLWLQLSGLVQRDEHRAHSLLRECRREPDRHYLEPASTEAEHDLSDTRRGRGTVHNYASQRFRTCLHARR